jgi:hypothetical protein
MLTYFQTSAIFTDDAGVPQSQAGDFYAGGDVGAYPEAVNSPLYQDVRNTGPLPQGFYTIGVPYDDPRLGPAMPLEPDAANVMYGRSLFFVHQINSKRDAGLPPYTAPPGRNSSDGCIVGTSAAAWEKIAALQKAGETRLHVVA